MNNISVQTALKLIRYNTDSEIATILQAAIDELDRLSRLEKHAVELARSALESVNDRDAAWQVIKLSKTEMPAPSEADDPWKSPEGDWQAANRLARG